MKRLPDLLVQQESFSELIMGNHALVRAMIEAGVKVVTTYPGSPTPEIADAAAAIPKDRRPFYFEYSVNEKVATEIAFGASMNGHLSTVFFKSVGLNVASDSLIQLPLMELAGGVVVVLGDDPGVNSSQNEQDNRHFSRMSYMPMYEPATPSEAYSMYLSAAKLAKEKHMPVFVRLTTHVCHASEVGQFSEIKTQPTNWTPKFDAEAGGPFIPIGPAVPPMKRRALGKLKELEHEEQHFGQHETLEPYGFKAIDNKKLGLISASLPAMSLMENLDELKAPVRLLKLGMTYPLPASRIKSFLKDCDEVLIIEELDRIMEGEIKTLAFDNQISCVIKSKPDEMLGGELGPAETRKILQLGWPELFTNADTDTEQADAEQDGSENSIQAVIPRTPTFCPGCGHRAAFYAIKQSLPEGAITVADIGCHTMGAFEPYNIGQTLLSMGHSNGTGSGFSIGNKTRKVVTFIGDSTFFHAGLPGIINAAIYNHNITLVVMENGTTAMTGQQPHPGSGEISEKIRIDKVLESLNIGYIKRVGAYSTDKLKAAFKEAMEYNGFAVVIASHPCMLKFGRNLKRKGKTFPKVMSVSNNSSEQELENISEFDCPSFHREDDGSISINPMLCVGDGSCKSSSPDLVLIDRLKEAE